MKNYPAIYKKLHSWYIIPCEIVKNNVGGKSHQLKFICVATASYTLGFLMTKSPGLVFLVKPKISKQTFFGIFIHGKNAYHTI